MLAEAEYEYDVCYKPSKANETADCLLRMKVIDIKDLSSFQANSKFEPRSIFSN